MTTSVRTAASVAAIIVLLGLCFVPLFLHNRPQPVGDRTLLGANDGEYDDIPGSELAVELENTIKNQWKATKEWVDEKLFR